MLQGVEGDVLCFTVSGERVFSAGFKNCGEVVNGCDLRIVEKFCGRKAQRITGIPAIAFQHIKNARNGVQVILIIKFGEPLQNFVYGHGGRGRHQFERAIRQFAQERNIHERRNGLAGDDQALWLGQWHGG